MTVPRMPVNDVPTGTDWSGRAVTDRPEAPAAVANSSISSRASATPAAECT